MDEAMNYMENHPIFDKTTGRNLTSASFVLFIKIFFWVKTRENIILFPTCLDVKMVACNFFETIAKVNAPVLIQF